MGSRGGEPSTAPWDILRLQIADPGQLSFMVGKSPLQVEPAVTGTTTLYSVPCPPGLGRGGP